MVGGDHLQCCYREQLSYALYSKFREPKLFHLVVKGDWDLIPARCQNHPKEAQFVHKYAPHDTALHRLLRGPSACELDCQLDAETVYQMNQMKLTAVKALLEANRLAAVQQDSFGRTPLHLACMEGDDDGSIAATILEINPAAAVVVDNELRTPLHFLVARSSGTINAALVQELVTQYPGAIFRQDAVGDTVLDLVQQRAHELENADEIMELLKSVPDERRHSSKVLQLPPPQQHRQSSVASSSQRSVSSTER